MANVTRAPTPLLLLLLLMMITATLGAAPEPSLSKGISDIYPSRKFREMTKLFEAMEVDEALARHEEKAGLEKEESQVLYGDSNDGDILLCNGEESTGVRVAIGILSQADSEEGAARRKAIRETWLASSSSLPSWKEQGVQIKFFLGLTRQKKQQQQQQQSTSRCNGGDDADDGGSGDCSTGAAELQPGEFGGNSCKGDGGFSGGDGGGLLHVSDETLAEQRQYGDLLVLDVEESYANIFYKAIAVFHWGSSKCRADYVMRVNDDVYIRLQPLLDHFLAQPPHLVYGGYFLEGVTVCRAGMPGLHGRSVCPSREEYPDDVYPTFAQGNVVVLSGDLAHVAGLIAYEPARHSLPDDLATALSVLDYQPVLHYMPASFSSDQQPVLCDTEALVHMDMDVATMRKMHTSALSMGSSDRGGGGGGGNICDATPVWRSGGTAEDSGIGIG